ncbi:hypothetical protein INT48_002460 [Thamnidium elegans]|uniref:Uncharacterized protein n=1 Tax=Thamnidium elegans TaxID=101142 RepID=A0A8H7VPK8_9FUNG|nr:hypothetical protein INT48_002460 [Thamnidium elegans]
MVSLKTFLSTSVALIAAFVAVEAAVAPTYPFPGTIQTEGQSYDITWNFMTGSNDVQSVLSTVATDVDPAALKYTFVTPQVSPHAAVYFFMFTGSDGDVAWATRFGIVGADGKLEAEEKKTQSDGSKIPWGIGKLLSVDSSSSSSSNNTTAPATPSAETTPSPVESPVENEVVTPPAASSSVSSVAQVKNAETTAANGASMVKPVLTLASAAIAGYLAL